MTIPHLDRSRPPLTLVTGGSRGLGRNAALTLAARGHDVVLTYRGQAAAADAVVGEITAQGGRAAALALDVADSGAFPAFVQRLKAVLAERFGRDTLDHVVHNAGMGVHAPLAETTEAQFDDLVRVHLKGPLFLTQALLALIADGGAILHVSSGLARFTLPGYGAYAAMKGGVEVLTRYLAKELGARGIRVNTLAPGAIETDFGGGAVRDDAAVNAMVAGNTALGRAGLPDDIGGAVATLLSPDSRWINGQRVEASGGMFL